MIIWKTRIFSEDGSYDGYIGDGWLIGDERRPATIDEVRESIRGWIEKYIVHKFGSKNKEQLVKWALEDISKEPFEEATIWEHYEEDGTKKKYTLGYAIH